MKTFIIHGCALLSGSSMNRLAVYNYLTRYTYVHVISGRLFSESLPENKCVAWVIGNRIGPFSEQARTNGHIHPGLAFQDLMLGWKQPESR